MRISAQVKKLAEERGGELVQALLEIALDKTVPTALRISAGKEVLPFLSPRLASSEISVDPPETQARFDKTAMLSPRLRSLAEDYQLELVRLRQEEQLEALA